MVLDCDSPTRPQHHQPATGATEADKITIEEYVQSLREFERMKSALLYLSTWIKESIDATCSAHAQNKETGYNAVIEFLRAAHVVAPTFAVGFYTETVGLFPRTRLPFHSSPGAFF